MCVFQTFASFIHLSFIKTHPLQVQQLYSIMKKDSNLLKKYESLTLIVVIRYVKMDERGAFKFFLKLKYCHETKN